MCTRIRAGLATRLVCVLLFLSGFALSGTCQNAEPRRSFGARSAVRDLELREDDMLRDESDRQFDWDASPEGEKPLDENRRSLSSRGGQAEAKTSETEAEVAPRADGNRNTALLPPKGAAKSSSFSSSPSSSSSSSASSTQRRGLNVTSATSGGRRRGSGGDRSGRDKRRRAKESTARNSSGSMDFYDRPRDGGVGEDVRENEIRGKRGQQAVDKRGVATSAKKSKDPRGRKFRAERRRRRKNRERKRGRKRTRVGEDRTTSAKYKRKMNDAPAALFLGRIDAERSEDAKYLAENASGINGRSRNNSADEMAMNIDSRIEREHLTTTTTESSWLRPKVTPRRSAENVERELSKKLEQEITRSGLDDYSSLEDRILGTSIVRKPESRSESLSKEAKGTSNEVSSSTDDRARFGNSRYDAEKMLGYSRTAEDLPILDLENEVLARTIKDYNAYMTNSLKLSALKRHNEESERRKGPVYHGQPIRDGDENWQESSSPTTMGRASTTTLMPDEDDKTRGDLSCINGTFLPAPLARHALIKYVKSSIPGHEYLEADYECTPGYYMASASSRLLCRDRQWVGQVPKCKVKQSVDGACAEAPCEHVCKELAGRAVCSCYTGFRLDGYKCIDVNECEENNGECEHRCINTPGSFRCECPKGMKQGEDRFTCMDINECLLNNGHGPCQDTCRNLVGGYECSCEGLQDTVLSADNHTCQDAGPCSINNAGCSHTCLSTMGRVFCLCPDGFMLEDDWKTCQDVDECAVPDLQTEVCRYGCINTPGSYRCAEPMELKDQPILDTLSITCLPGYEATADNTCIDINECEVDNGGCTEVCENTDGSFFCACDGDEKALSSDGKSCLDINNVACPPLNPAGRGYLMCSRMTTPKPWRGRRRTTNRPGTKCYLKCPHGYQLHGEYELACRSDGTWDGPKHGECVRYSKPRLECPKDVIAEVPPGHDEAFVTFDQPATDLDWFRYVRSKPSWGTRLEANLKPGTHEIAFFARHPVSKKQASCVLRIIVKGGEAPKVKDCPRDIEVTGKNGTTITWTEPIFTDNVKVTRIRSNENPGRPFDIGGHKIEYEASDEAGWSSKCVFTVVLRQE